MSEEQLKALKEQLHNIVADANQIEAISSWAMQKHILEVVDRLRARAYEALEQLGESNDKAISK